MNTENSNDPSASDRNDPQPLLDPYAVQPPTVVATGDALIRPTGVTVIAVICLLAGIVGVISGAFGLIGMFFGEYFAGAFVQPGDVQDLQRKMQAEVNAITHKYFWFTLPLSLVSIAVSGCLAAGGIGLLGLHSWARVLVRRVLLLAMAVELIRAVIYVLTQLELTPVMLDYMERIAESSGGPGGQAMGQMMNIMMMVGIGFWLIWTLLKVGLMWWGSQYLNRPATKKLFAESATSS